MIRLRHRRSVSLTASLIVRDEERHLDACLASLSGVVDDIVVVDTGSTDSSIDIACDHGARIDRIDWPEDFAAARNHALGLVRTDWVLYVDADERVRPIDPAVLRREIGGRRTVGATVDLHPRTGHTAYRELRLFRSDPRLRFRGVIHETIWPAVHDVMARNLMWVRPSSLVIHHVGYDGPQDHKHPRNLPLLRRALAEDPDHVYCWYHLGATLRAIGDKDGAREAWLAGIDVLRRRGSTRPADSLPFIELIQADLADSRDVAGLMVEAREMFPRDPVLRWIGARMAMLDGRHEEAIAGFTTLAHEAGRGDLTEDLGYPSALFGATTFAMIATCHFERADHRAAADFFARAESAEPNNIEYRTKRVLSEHLASR